jgi:CRP/FNR family transcriptional regulator, cyclic AMP receptor protein
MTEGSGSKQEGQPAKEPALKTLEEVKAKAMEEVKAASSVLEMGTAPESTQDEAGAEKPKITRNLGKHMEAICNLPFVNDLDEGECGWLAGVASIVTLKKGQILIEQGKRDDALYVLISGRLQVNREMTGGGHVTLACIREGEMAGEMGFLDGSEHSATLQADDTTEVLQIKREHLEGLLNEHPQIVYKLMRAIAREVHEITKRMNMQYVEMSNYINRQHGRY